jgi:lipid-binding SYLF domain-containing protein
MFRNLSTIIKRVLMLISFLLIVSVNGFAQSDSKREKLSADAQTAKAEFIKAASKMSSLFSNAYGYVIFPNVGKGAVAVGGAAGNGVAFEKGAKIGYAKLTQVSIGFQWGGQAYREVIFFESKAEMDRFKEDRVEFSAQVSAVAAKTGASANFYYAKGRTYV